MKKHRNVIFLFSYAIVSLLFPRIQCFSNSQFIFLFYAFVFVDGSLLTIVTNFIVEYHRIDKPNLLTIVTSLIVE